MYQLNIYYKTVYITLWCAIFFSCGSIHQRNKEAREDEKTLHKSIESQRLIQYSTFASKETVPVDEALDSDSADDPAIWCNKNDMEKSRIYGSNKLGGIYVYDLNGNVEQYFQCGKINNIDIRDYHGNSYIAGSNRTDNTIMISRLDSNGSILISTTVRIPLDMNPYGFCLGVSDNSLFAFVNDKQGKIEQWQVDVSEPKNTRLKRTFNVKTQPEAMVYDDKKYLYVGEEECCIHQFDILTGQDIIFENSRNHNNENISYDIEGLCLFNNAGEEYILASSQGNFSFAIFDVSNKRYINSFKIVGGNNIDGVEETDGIDINQRIMTSEFPKGIMVVQDGFNTYNEIAEPQNFKIVDMQSILHLLEK